MSSVDERTVKMRFDNAEFKREAIATKASLDQVDAAVGKVGKGRGLMDIASQMQTVRVRAGLMQVAVITALSNVVNKAVDAGIKMGKALTLDPISQGFNEYELKMKSIRTILANTTGENLKSVTGYLDDLNTYSDKTIYNFANMTENIGKMTTAGIELGTATEVVKGFSNMVALAGGDSMAAAGALEQFVYGLQAGKITALDWQSIATRGLGSVSLQKAFYETAKAAGTLGDVPVGQTYEEWSKAVGGFKGSLESGWLTADVATDALSIMTGDVKDVGELMKQGFSEQAAKDLIEIAGKASLAATEVYSFTTFMDTLKEQIGSGWAKVLESVIGDVNESTALFTGWANTTGRILNKMFTYIGNLAKGWAKFGGQAAALKTIQHVLAPIATILGAIAKAWKMAFGGTETGKGLAEFTKLLEFLTRPLNILAKLISGQITPLEAFGRMLQWGGNLVSKFTGFVGALIQKVAGLAGISIPTGGGFLGWFKDLGREIKEAISKIADLIAKGESLRDAFGKVSIKLPKMPKLPGLPDIGGMLGGESSDGESKIAGISSSLKGLTDNLNTFNVEDAKASGGMMFNPDADISGGRVIDAADQVGDALNDLKTQQAGVETVGDKMSGTLDMLKEKFFGFIKNFSFEDLTASFNLAVLATFMISMSRFFNTLTKSFEGFVGVGESVNGILEGAGNALGSFQTQARAKLILNIAIAILLLAGALWLLAKIPADQLLKALGGMAALFVLLDFGLKSITKAVDAMQGSGTVLKMGSLSVALLALGAAILVLALAFLVLNKVKWSSVLKGLLTIRVVMVSMAQLGMLAEKSYKNILASAVAITAIAWAMVVLAGALLLFKLVDWEDMAKAGLTLAAVALAVGLLALIPYEGISKVGAAMLATSVGMVALAFALVMFAKVEWESIKKAAVILGLLTLALGALMLVGNPVSITGLLSMSVAMVALAAAGMVLNNVEWSSIGKIALIMGVLLVAFAAFLGIIYLASPVLPLLMGLALSLAALAGGLALLTLAVATILPLLAIGVGAFAAFATGAAVALTIFLTTLAAEAPIIKKALLDMLQVLIDGIVESTPMIIQGFKDLWAAIKKEFTEPKKAGFMGEQSKSWVDKLKDGIKKKLPELVETAKTLILRFINGLIDKSGKIAARGVDFVVNVINGIASRADKIVDSAVNLVVKFAEALGKNLDKIVNAGIKLIADFLHALANGIRNGSAAIGGGLTDVASAMAEVGVNMVKGLIAGIGSMAADALSAVGNLAGSMVKKATDVFDIRSPSRVFKAIGAFLVEGLTDGVQDNAVSAIQAVASMVSGQIAVANEYISEFIQKLDQQALAASAKAAGLAAAAEEASKSADRAASKAEKTKGKGDDKKAKKAQESAEKIAKQANKAAKAAEKAENKSQKAKDEQDRAEEFDNASRLDQAKMRSEDAQNQMEAAKTAEFMAAKKLQEAQALEKQAKADGVTKKEREALEKQAARLREEAKQQAKNANAEIAAAKASAADAISLQKLAGDEAALEFQKRYDDEAKEDQDTADFEKLTDTEKAAKRREQAQALKAQADLDLAEAKQLAYTDLEAANELAEKALEQADLARQYLTDAEDFDEAAKNGNNTQGAVVGGRVVDLAPTEAAALAFNNYASLYDSGVAAAATQGTVEFNQYNSSPESLNPIEVYRQTNNIVTHAVDKLQPAA